MEMSSRLDAVEARLGVGPRSGAVSRSQTSGTPVPVTQSPPSDAIPGGADIGFAHPVDRNVSVIIRPLRDLGMARVVEQVLADTDGVERARLRELRGDSAVIDTRVDEGVSLISELRRRLPVAFDVTASDESSLTIALAQPPTNNPADGVGREIL